MSRLPQYLAYHRESARVGDIDPSRAMLQYLADRYEINVEQRYWFAFLYSLTYNGASAFYLYNEWPDYENVDIGRMNRWWEARGREETACQTDRRWVRSANMFVPAVKSYRAWLRGKTQEEHFNALTTAATPEARYDKLYASAKCLHSYGQFALFLYLEALDTVTPLDLVPTDLDLSKAWSCRNGLVYAYGMDQHLTVRETPTPVSAREDIAIAWADLRSHLQPASNVWNIETTLCAFRKWKDGKRYIGSYLDRQATEIQKMEEHVRVGVDWRVLWQYRAETYEAEQLMEHSSLGLRDWRDWRLAKTRVIVNG
ncbi:MAG: hypothetical protein NUV51_09475 [Sulfuricaulis sp.]|nr:hypothetical protein [Sulfuricaulis sp.]